LYFFLQKNSLTTAIFAVATAALVRRLRLEHGDRLQADVGFPCHPELGERAQQGGELEFFSFFKSLATKIEKNTKKSIKYFKKCI
jgi:hypothetical protein